MFLPPIALTGSLQNPAFSPDGKSLAFTRFRNGYNAAPADVFVIELATGKLSTILAEDAESVSAPGAAWHATGGILFSSDRNGHDEIWSFNADVLKQPSWSASALTQLTSRADFVAWEPSWAPDGQSIAFESHPDKDGDTPGQIVTHNIGTDKYVPLTNVTRDCRQPNWSPDGRAIVFQEQLSGDRWNVVVYDIASATEHIIAAGTDATWSPDSARILFSDNDGHLATVAISGGIALKVTGSPTGYKGAPSWSPDGKSICCEASASDPDGGPGTKLLLIPVESAPGLSLPPQPNVSPMPQTVPPQIAALQAFMGQGWSSGPPPAFIRQMLSEIAAAWPNVPGMVAYCNSAANEPGYWSACGCGAGYAMTKAGIAPIFGADDLHRILWAEAWLDFGTPVPVAQAQPGDIAVYDFGGGDHHVTVVKENPGNGTLICLGANQGHKVQLSTFANSSVQGIRRPPGALISVGPIKLLDDPAQRPSVKLGDVGVYVLDLQQRLGFTGANLDSEFGEQTDAAVRAYQSTHGLDIDGEVGTDTWTALLGKAPAVAVASAGGGALSADAIAKIVALARISPARTGWSNGSMPVGCINGLAVSYGMAYRDLKAGTSAALAMAKPLGGVSTDALAWYGVTASDPVALLRANFQLLFGSCMRESSGNYSEGRDMSASNVQSDTAEAGLFQQSENSFGASPELPKLLAQWRVSADDGLLPTFREGVADKQTQDYGSGDGALFQHLCKSKPLFAVYCAAVGQRVIRAHWGPINRKEAQMRPEVNTLLLGVQAIVDALPAPTAPPDKPPINGQVLHPGDPIVSHPPAAVPANPLSSPLLLAGIAALFSSLIGHTQMTNTTTPAQGFDFSKLLADVPKFFAILQDPIVQRLVSNQPVTLNELLTIPPELFALLTGGKLTALPVPQIAAPVAQPAAVAMPAAADPAAVAPPPAAPSGTPSWLVNLAAGVVSAVIPGAGWLTGLLGDTAAVGTAATGISASALNIPGLLSKLLSGFKITRA